VKSLHYKTKDRYSFWGPKSVAGNDVFTLVRIEVNCMGISNCLVLSLTLSPVVIWKRGLCVPLEASGWQEQLAKEIRKMEG
jgi:hypothetical protein